MSDPARLETLEIKMAHLERAIQEVSDVLYRQQQEVADVRDRLARLAQGIVAQDEQAGTPLSAVEIPPHY